MPMDTLGHRQPSQSKISFYRLLSDAIADIADHGYVSREQIERWIGLLRGAADHHLPPDAAIDMNVREAFDAIYERLVYRGKVMERVPDVGRYTLAMIQPHLRAELDRRILAAADLIKLHRREAIEKTLQRFAGWSTSIPAGGEGAIDKREVRATVSKSLGQYKFERRRVEIDQAHKLSSNVAEIVATNNGAIAAVWRSHWRQPGYNFRRDHKDRDEKVYAIRGNWAIDQGLMKKGAGYTDEMTAPGEEVYCRCWYEYIVSPRRLPDSMLTHKGQEWVREQNLRRAA